MCENVVVGKLLERNILILTSKYVGGQWQTGTRQNFSDFHFIAFINRPCQSYVICIAIYLKLLIIDRETNWQSSTGSNVGLVPWGYAKPGSDSENVPLLLVLSGPAHAICRGLF